MFSVIFNWQKTGPLFGFLPLLLTIYSVLQLGIYKTNIIFIFKFLIRGVIQA